MKNWKKSDSGINSYVNEAKEISFVNFKIKSLNQEIKESSDPAISSIKQESEQIKTTISQKLIELSSEIIRNDNDITFYLAEEFDRINDSMEVGVNHWKIFGKTIQHCKRYE
jgi:hypothetical protein